MSRKNTSSKSLRSGNRAIIYGGLGLAVLGAIGAGFYFVRPGRRMSGASSLDTLPANPTEDQFGNRGEDNLVEPLTLREDQILMRDRMNPYNGLY